MSVSDEEYMSLNSEKFKRVSALYDELQNILLYDIDGYSDIAPEIVYFPDKRNTSRNV